MNLERKANSTVTESWNDLEPGSDCDRPRIKRPSNATRIESESESLLSLITILIQTHLLSYNALYLSCYLFSVDQFFPTNSCLSRCHTSFAIVNDYKSFAERNSYKFATRENQIAKDSLSLKLSISTQKNNKPVNCRRTKT